MTPEVEPSIAHLDWPVCQCEMDECQGQCASEAVVLTEFHALDHCNSLSDEINADGNRELKLCQRCYERLRQIIGVHVLALGKHGRPMCVGCGAPVRCVRDVIRSAEKL